MRIEEINISGFGVFNQARVENLDPCLNILLGENESGKSTCLEFLRTVLFGSVVGKGARGASKYPAPPGSEPGGSVIIRTSDNQLLKQTWQPGTGAGKQGLWAIENGELQARDVNDFLRLSGHINRPLYSAVYGFSLDQLQELNSLKEDARVADILYGAGFGLGALSLPQVLSDLDEKYKKGLFTPKGEKQPINQIIFRLKALREEMKQYADAMPKYNQIEQELARLSDKILQEQNELAQIRLIGGSLQDLLKLQLNLPRLEQMRLRMAELTPQTMWSEEQFALLEEYNFIDLKNLVLQTNKLQEEVNNIGLKQAKLAQELGRGAEHALILEVGPEIKKLLEEKARYTALQQELASISTAIKEVYSSSNFTFCFGQEFRDLQPEEQQSRLADYLEKMQARKDEFGQLQAQWEFLNNPYKLKDEKELKSTTQSSSGLVSGPVSLPAAAPVSAPVSPPVAEQNLTSTQAREQEAPEQLNQSFSQKLKQETTSKTGKLLGLDYRVIIGLELLAGVALFVWLYQSPQISPIWMALELGVFFLIIGGIGLKLFNKNRTTRLAQQKLKEQQENLEKSREGLLNKSRQILDDLLPLLSLEGCVSHKDLSNADIAALFDNYPQKHAKQMQDTLDSWQQAQLMLGKAQEIASLLLLLDQQAERLNMQLMPVGSAVSAVSVDASGSLGFLDSPGSPGPAGSSGSLDALANELQINNHNQPNTPKCFLTIMAQLESRLNQARQAQLEQSKINGQLDGFSQQQLAAQDELAKSQLKIQTIYAQAKVRNIDELEHMYKLWNEKNELNSKLSKLENELLDAARDIFNKLANLLPGNDISLKELAGELGGDLFKTVQSAEDLLHLAQLTSREKLGLEVERLSRRTQALEELLREETKQQGALQQQASALISEDRMTALAFEESALQEELNVLSRKWTVAALAQHFLLQAKAAFEQEHQTAVMSGASKYFNQITNGAYQGLDPSADLGSFAVLTKQGERRTPEQLSRGTREQLYLALRLALIEDRTANSSTPQGEEQGQKLACFEPLPLIMDDVLVNFDPQRVKRSIKSILTLASSHQIFYFTCQPHMLPLLCKQAEISNCSYKCFNLAGGQISPA